MTTEQPPTKSSFAELVESVQGAISVREARLLRRLARATDEGVIVEVGSFRGRSTVALAKGAREGGKRPIYAIDPHEPFDGVFGGKFGPTDRRVFFESMLRTGSWRNVRLVNLSSEVVTAGWEQPVGLLWIDGDHRYEGVKRDFESWAPHLMHDAVVAFDDTNRGGPQLFVEELLDGEWTLAETVGKVRALRRA